MLRLIWLLAFGVCSVGAFGNERNSKLYGHESLEVDCAATQYSFVRLLSGFEPERLSDHELILHPGVVADRYGNLASSSKKIIIDTTVRGIGGVEEGNPLDGVSHHVYLVREKGGASLNAILSSKISATRLDLPEKFEVVRKLPWGFVPIKGEIPPFHLSFWPKPFTRFTDASSSSLWAALFKGDSANFSAIDFSRWVPDNARMVYLLIEVDSKGPLPGTAVIRVGGSKGEGVVVGKSFGGSGTMLTLHQRINSSRKLVYKVTGDAVLTIYVLGYSNTEPS